MTVHAHALADQTIQSLQHLIEVNLDSAEGFMTAAQTVNDPRLRQLFDDIGRTRAEFAEQLQRIVARDQTPQTGGTLGGAAHRWWLKLRGSLQSDNAYAVLSEVERAEDHMKELYEDSIVDCAEPEIRDLIEEQFVVVKAGHDRVRDLRDAYGQAS